MSPKTATRTVVSTNTNEFMDYPVDLLQGLKGMGRGIIDDAKLYAAVTAYAERSDSVGSTLGPALLTKDAREIVVSTTTQPVPADLGKPAIVAVAVDPDAEVGWDALDLDDLIALAAKHDVTVQGRVKTHGKMVSALEAAGISPPA